MAGSSSVTIIETGKNGIENEKITLDTLIGATIIEIDTQQDGININSMKVRTKKGRIVNLWEWNEQYYECTHGGIDWEVEKGSEPVKEVPPKDRFELLDHDG
jgi:hypothetical protein